MYILFRPANFVLDFGESFRNFWDDYHATFSSETKSQFARDKFPDFECLLSW